MNKKDFALWLLELMSERKLKAADLSRMTSVDPAVISRLLSAERGPKPRTLEAIATGLDLPVDAVYRAAGMLPPESPENELINQIVHLTEQLPEREQEDILEFVKLRRRLAQERGKHERSKRPAKQPALS